MSKQEMPRREVKILQVDNGYVVTVTRQGVSTFKTRYEAPVTVAKTFTEMASQVASIFEAEAED